MRSNPDSDAVVLIFLRNGEAILVTRTYDYDKPGNSHPRRRDAPPPLSLYVFCPDRLFSFARSPLFGSSGEDYDKIHKSNLSMSGIVAARSRGSTGLVYPCSRIHTTPVPPRPPLCCPLAQAVENVDAIRGGHLSLGGAAGV